MILGLLLGLLKFVLVGSLVLYVVRVVMTLRAEGPHYPLSFVPNDLVRSAERLLIWLGVRAAVAILAVLNASLRVLEETSAELGEWVIHHRSS